MQVNNQLIGEAYALAKRREYAQRHLAEADLNILDPDYQAATMQ